MNDHSASVVRGNRVALAELAASQCKYVTRPFGFAARLREYPDPPDDLHRYLLDHSPFRPTSLQGSMQFAAHATRAAAATDVPVRRDTPSLEDTVPERFEWPVEARDRLAAMAEYGDRALAEGSAVDAALDQRSALCHRAADALREAADEYAALLADAGLVRDAEPRSGDLRALLAAVGLVTAGTVILLREDGLGGRCIAAGMLVWPDRELDFAALDPPGVQSTGGQARLTEF